MDRPGILQRDRFLWIAGGEIARAAAGPADQLQSGIGGGRQQQRVGGGDRQLDERGRFFRSGRGIFEPHRSGDQRQWHHG